MSFATSVVAYLANNAFPLLHTCRVREQSLVLFEEVWNRWTIVRGYWVTLSLCFVSMAIQDPERASKPIDVELAMVFEHKHVNRAAWIRAMMLQYESSCTSENVEATIVRAQSKEQGSSICWVRGVHGDCSIGVVPPNRRKSRPVCHTGVFSLKDRMQKQQT